MQELAGDANAVAQENLSAQAVVKAYGLEDESIKTYGQRLRESLKASLRLSLIGQLFEGTINLSVSIAQLLVLGAGSILVINGTIDDPGKMVTLLLLLPAVFVPMGLLADVGQSLQMASGSIQRVNEIIEEPIEIENKPGAKELPQVDEEIKVDHVNFSYDEDRPILRDVDLVIPAGKNVALVGPSGSGKSTIVNLLMRFWDPNDGSIKMDGQDLRDVSLESLRGQIGIVFQDTFIFNSSIRDNIAIGKLDATEEEIEAAARAAQLDSFIQAQPAGLRHGPRRARLAHEWWSTTEAGDRSSDPPRPADPHPGRGDKRARRTHRGRHPRHLEGPREGAHDDQHHPPLDNRRHGRPHLRLRPGQVDRTGAT